MYTTKHIVCIILYLFIYLFIYTLTLYYTILLNYTIYMLYLILIVGKTTMIEYLAARTGHKCVRINNHEHTDVQEYIGGYVTDASGMYISYEY